ncbi:hypothetical protein AB205_0024420 [Aquarana catesbeiana]|uniref:Secreted protein n=1 Tax=Aquarana catesbeiana TaxID=8400 RepID=A0A2G9S8N1_AQUCT|nr:hypothetical protein AB205_0024420 [Aquarana catesbeiana]
MDILLLLLTTSLPATWTNALAVLTLSLSVLTMDSIPACCLFCCRCPRSCLLPRPMLSSVDHCTTKTKETWKKLTIQKTCYAS